MKLRNLVAACAISVVAAGVGAIAPSGYLGGLGIDALFWLRHQAASLFPLPPPSDVAVIAIDEETYRRAPFRGVPKVMWTPYIATVLDGVVAADAAVVGFDVILSTSVERYIRGFERDYMIALRNAARQGKVVLGKVQHQTSPIAPFAGHSFAVGNARNIRSVNVTEDTDGVIRSVPLWFRASGPDGASRVEPSMSMELAGRAAKAEIRIGPDRPTAFAGRVVPTRGDGSMLLNFDTRPGAIPTYSLADLVACKEKGDTAYFRRHFAGKTVLLGVVLDVEDRKLSSMRLATAPDGARLPQRCALPVMQELYRQDLRRDAIPGVYLHATAVNNLLHGTALRVAGPVPKSLIALALAAGMVAAVMLLSAWWAGAAMLGGVAVWTGTATVAFANGLVLPLLDPAAGSVLAFVLAFAFRFAVADRDKRKLRRAFALYLPASEVDRLAASETPPLLGGESRTLSVLFSDIADFTRIAEGLSPEALVAFLNRYLTLMTDTIEAHGGIVDKYIGDAVIGVFGAPIEDPDHALSAVRAALACQRLLAERRGELGLASDIPLATRIGINTGEMVIGNIGSARRFNYTVMGDAVNLASRLEGANKEFGSRILVSGETARRCDGQIRFREIASVRVLGRGEPTTLMEPLGDADDARLAAFDAARDLFEAGRFAEAADAFAALEAGDPVAAGCRRRAEAMAAESPSEHWDGVIDLDRK